MFSYPSLEVPGNLITNVLPHRVKQYLTSRIPAAYALSMHIATKVRYFMTLVRTENCSTFFVFSRRVVRTLSGTAFFL